MQTSKHHAHLVRFVEQDAYVVALVAQVVRVALLGHGAVGTLDLLERSIIIHLVPRSKQWMTGTASAARAARGERSQGWVARAVAQARAAQSPARFGRSVADNKQACHQRRTAYEDALHGRLLAWLLLVGAGGL